MSSMNTVLFVIAETVLLNPTRLVPGCCSK